MFDWIPSGILLMKIRKKELDIESWGTPAKSSFQLEV